MTPLSVRFLGRKAYLGAVVILISAMRQGPTPRQVHELSTLFGVDRATVARWQAFRCDYIPQTPCVRGTDPAGAARTEAFDPAQ
jgi:hypothetical protein